MNDFATILTLLEEATRSAERGAGARLASLLGAFARGDSPSRSGANDDTSLAARIYRAAAASAQAAPAAARGGEARSQRLPDREEFFAALRHAEGSLEDLRALRRRYAWLCHPDRREKAGARQAERLLAEFNAQIDAAIARAPAMARRAAAPRKRAQR